MKQKFIIKHLSSESPLVLKLLSMVVNHTRSVEPVPCNPERIVNAYVNHYPKGVYYYNIEQNGNEWCLWEDDEMVLHLELIEIHELAEKEPTKFY